MQKISCSQLAGGLLLKKKLEPMLYIFEFSQVGENVKILIGLWK